MNLTLTEPGHHLQSELDPQKPDGDTLGALIVAGKTLVLRNIGIGRGSLFRNRIFNDETRIGFHCEIGKSYFAGHDNSSGDASWEMLTTLNKHTRIPDFPHTDRSLDG